MAEGNFVVRDGVLEPAEADRTAEVDGREPAIQEEPRPEPSPAAPPPIERRSRVPLVAFGAVWYASTGSDDAPAEPEHPAETGGDSWFDSPATGGF